MVLLTCDKNHINILILFLRILVGEDLQLLTTVSNFATIMW